MPSSTGKPAIAGINAGSYHFPLSCCLDPIPRHIGRDDITKLFRKITAPHGVTVIREARLSHKDLNLPRKLLPMGAWLVLELGVGLVLK